MDRIATRLLCIALLAVACVLACGEESVGPIDCADGLSGSRETGSALSAAGRGRGPSDAAQKGTFLIASKGGIIAAYPKGGSFLFHTYGAHTCAIEVLGTRIFWLGGRTIHEFDHLGNILAVIDIPPRIEQGLDFTVLPGGDFAIHDNKADSVYFMDAAGVIFEAVAMPDSSPISLQMTKGLVLDGKLLISETGTRKIAEIDLETYEASIFRDLSDPPVGWFGDIEHLGRYFYLTRSSQLQRFTETDGLETVKDFSREGNVVGIAILKHKGYLVLNFTGKFYEVNLSSGRAKCLLEGLDWPRDVEFIPVVLEPPPPPYEASALKPAGL